MMKLVWLSLLLLLVSAGLVAGTGEEEEVEEEVIVPEEETVQGATYPPPQQPAPVTEEVEEEEIVPETEAPLLQTEQPVVRTKPTSEWGSYYSLNPARMQQIFDDVFTDFKIQDPDASKCKSTSVTQGTYNRYYQSIDRPNKFILSYFCLPSRGYEHLVAIVDDVDSGTGEYVSFADKLSDIGVFGAGDYHEDDTQTDEEAEEFARSLFEQVKEQIVDDCPEPSFSTDFKLQSKVENGLQYWMFPVACTMKEPDDMFTDVEVFQDTVNNWVNNGELTLVGHVGLSSNQKYHVQKAMEEAARKEEEERQKELAELSAKQSFSFTPAPISVTLLAAVAALTRTLL